VTQCSLVDMYSSVDVTQCSLVDITIVWDVTQCCLVDMYSSMGCDAIKFGRYVQ
jgi:hypothetical protein